MRRTPLTTSPRRVVRLLQAAGGGVAGRVSASSRRARATTETVRRSTAVVRHQADTHLRHAVRQRATAAACSSVPRRQRARLGQSRYDTIRDAILTCAREPTWVSLIYRTVSNRRSRIRILRCCRFQKRAFDVFQLPKTYKAVSKSLVLRSLKEVHKPLHLFFRRLLVIACFCYLRLTNFSRHWIAYNVPVPLKCCSLCQSTCSSAAVRCGLSSKFCCHLLVR